MPNKKGKKSNKPKNINNETIRPLEFKDVEDLQEYAQILKSYGNSRFEVKCFDGKNRTAHAPGSLKKKKIFVKNNDVIIVSLRSFDDSKCDILYVYNAREVKELKKLDEIPSDINVDENESKEVDIGFDIEEDDGYDGNKEIDIDKI
jgi:translation initiation factor 1A